MEEPKERPTYEGVIEKFYDATADHQWIRLRAHRIEYVIQSKLLESYVKPKSRILDCGGGPGRYAIEWTKQGHLVTLFDLSKANLELAKEKATASGVDLEDYVHGTAVDLSKFESDSFDCVVEFGPFYHLLEEDDRRKAMLEAIRVTKPGGLIVFSFLNKLSWLRYMARNMPTQISQYESKAREVLKTGYLSTPQNTWLFTEAYTVFPNQVPNYLTSFELEILCLAGSESFLGGMSSGVNTLVGKAWNVWESLALELCTHPDVIACSDHILAICKKKG